MFIIICCNIVVYTVVDNDIFGSRKFVMYGFFLAILNSIFMAGYQQQTPLMLIVVTLFVNGISMGLWTTPNQVITLNATPKSNFGPVGALINVTRNTGNVTGQAISTAVISAVMAFQGFDIELLKENAQNVNPLLILQIASVNGMKELAKRVGFTCVDDFSMGTLDVNIVFDFANSAPDGHPLKGFGTLLSDQSFSQDLPFVISIKFSEITLIRFC